MSKHNYSQYSNNNKKNNHSNKAVTPEPVETDIAEPVVLMGPIEVMPVNGPCETAPVIVNETVDTVVLPKTVKGTVTNCAKLNVRVKPNVGADVVCVLNAASEVVINVDKSNKEWLAVCTNTGAKGYCMRKFVDARL